MNRWKRWIIKLARKLGAYGTLDTEKTIRILRTENLHLKQALADAQQYMPWNKPHVTVEIDPALKAQAQSQIGCYEPPERTTDTPRIIPSPHGRYAQQRWPEFRKTHLMPTVKWPPQDDMFTSAEMTAVRIPTWIL